GTNISSSSSSSSGFRRRGLELGLTLGFEVLSESELPRTAEQEQYLHRRGVNVEGRAGTTVDGR
ncbi:hypothetical protein LINGRAPRIM_LOCUS2932, partial [Linum grandiflorum]